MEKTDVITKSKEYEITHEDMFIGGTSVFLLVTVFMIGGVLATGIVTGLISAIGFGFLVFKLRKHKPALWNTMVDHPLATDVVISVGFIMLLAPMTATGIIAGASAAVFSSAGVTGASKLIGRVEGVESMKIPWFKKPAVMNNFAFV